MVVIKLLVNLSYFLLLWKMFLEETSSIFFISTIHVKKNKIWIYTKGVSWEALSIIL